MANLSNYIPVYVRTNGNDTTGDGSLNNPFLTAQKAFDTIYDIIISYGNTTRYVIDCGAGNFGTINIGLRQYPGGLFPGEWTDSIGIRGVGIDQSFLSGVNGDGFQPIYDYDNQVLVQQATNGNNIHIVSDKSINLGNIHSIGGINNLGGFAPNSGNITLVDCVCNNIDTSAAETGAIGPYGYPGSVTLYTSVCGNIISNGGITEDYYSSNGGTIYVYNSRVNSITSLGGLSNPPSSPSVIPGAGGNVLSVSSVIKSINLASIYGVEVPTRSDHGTLTLSGYSTVPDTIINANVVISGLFQGSCPNSI